MDVAYIPTTTTLLPSLCFRARQLSRMILPAYCISPSNTSDSIKVNLGVENTNGPSRDRIPDLLSHRRTLNVAKGFWNILIPITTT